MLPEDVVFLGNPDPEDIVKKVEEAIPLAKNINSQQIHDRLKDKYSWRDVAARTVILLMTMQINSNPLFRKKYMIEL